MTIRFFFSGEIDILVADSWRSVAYPLERRLNDALGQRSYGPAVGTFALIPIIQRPEWQDGIKERRLFQRREAAADYRTQIDFQQFTDGNDRERERLIVANLIAAVRDVSRKAGKGFDGDALVADILAVVDVASSERTIPRE